MNRLFHVLLFTVLCISNTYAQNWNQIIKAVASDREANDCFGYSVSISGDYAIIGAFRDDLDAGSAYIFHNNGTSWTEMQKIVASDREDGDRFGFSVSISGDYAIIGAEMEDENVSGGSYASDAGSAYIFHREGTIWAEQQKIVAFDRTANDYFGYSVSISGDYAIIGAYGEGHDVSGGNFLNQAGSVYIFVRNATVWTEQQKIVSSDRAEEDKFGCSVSISGDYALVGAYQEDINVPGNAYTGSAYIFNRNGTTWMEQQKIIASDHNTSDCFGVSVSISGNYAIVGAKYEGGENSDGISYPQAGAAYIFVRNGTTWTEQQKIVASDRAPSDYFGASVSISGDYAIVGAYWEDHNILGGNELRDSGSSYLYQRKGSKWFEQQKIVATDRKASDYFGISVSISGNNCIIGAYGDDDYVENDYGHFSLGSAYIFKTRFSLRLSVKDTIIQTGEIGCFNAYDTIKVGEDGNPVILKSSSSVNFIAGRSVQFLPGFQADSGSFMHAFITTDSAFCDDSSGSSIVNQPVEKSIERKELQEASPINIYNESIRIYPNPNNGKFNLALKNIEGQAEVDIYSSMGKNIYEQVIKNNPNLEINLPSIEKGIYFVRITCRGGKEQYLKKIVIY